MLILLYHNILTGEPRPWPVAHQQVHLDTFRRHLRHFQHRLLHPRQVAESLASGKTPRGVLITFDDGACGVEAAADELARVGAAGVCFVCPGAVKDGLWFYRLARLLTQARIPRLAFRDSEVSLETDADRRRAYRSISPVLFDLPPADRETLLQDLEQAAAVDSRRPFPPLDTLDEEGLRRTARTGGMWFANHTWSHPNLTTLGDEDLRHEIDAAGRWLADSGLPTLPWFAFPRGAYDRRVREVAARQHSLLFGATPVEHAPDVVPRTSLYEIDAQPLRFLVKTVAGSRLLRALLYLRRQAVDRAGRARGSNHSHEI